MNRKESYESGKTWNYPVSVIAALNKEIKAFYDRYNKGQKARDRIKYFNNEKAFYVLFAHIQNCTALDFSEIPKASWLQDLYNGLKNNSTLNRKYVEALLTTFGLSYDPIADKLVKKEAPIPADNTEVVERNNIIKFIAGKTRKSAELRNLTGKYKYFAGARRENKIYDYIYEHELEIYETGKTEIRNPFNHHTYLGIATITSNGNLQIISYNFDQVLLDGIGNLLTFRVNKYGRLTLLLPGMGATFDADGRPIATQTLLCTDLSYTKQTPLIRDYFDEIVPQLRMYSPEFAAVEKLIIKHLNPPTI
jgi:hypothetical protein